MEFSLREETKMLKSNAEKFMKEKCPSSFVKNLLKEEKGFSPEERVKRLRNRLDSFVKINHLESRVVSRSGSRFSAPDNSRLRSVAK